MLLMMHWALAVLALVFTGFVLRRILRLDEPLRTRARVTLPPRVLDQAYHPVAEEIETQTVILGVTLNDALAAVYSGLTETALAHICLAVGQVDLLAHSALNILDSIADYYPITGPVTCTHVLTASQFRSRAMIEFMEGGGNLHQFLFRSKPRFKFHIQTIQQTLEALASDFKASYAACERAPETSPAMWKEIAPIYHDFDLMVKEALLAYRSFLSALPDSSLDAFSSEITLKLRRNSVRSLRARNPQIASSDPSDQAESLAVKAAPEELKRNPGSHQ